MRICLCVHCFFPDHFYGTETYVLQLARQLIRSGCEVVVVAATFAGEPSQFHPVQEDVVEGVKVVRIDMNKVPASRLRHSYDQPRMAAIWDELLGRLKPDLLHVCHLINHTSAVLDVAQRRRIPLVATLTDFYGFCYTNHLQSADGLLCSGPDRTRTNCLACYLKARTSTLSVWGRSSLVAAWLPVLVPFIRHLFALPLLRRLPLGLTVEDLTARPDLLASRYRLYRAVITPTEFLAQAYQRQWPWLNTVPSWFGVDIDRAAKPVPSAGKPLRIGYIGQMAPHKGVDLLLQAFETLPEGSALLSLHGSLDQDPIYASHLRHLSARSPWIVYAGTFPHNAMASVLAEIDVLVIPSRWYENSPLVLLSALATHTPVVVADVAGMVEFLQDGINGFRFERGNWQDLARQLLRFLDEPILACQLSQTTSYPRDTAAMAADVLSLYREILNSSAD